MFARTLNILGSGIANLGRHFMLDRSGNLALAFAIVSVPLLGAVGASIDYVRALNMHREIQTNLDAALVAAVQDIAKKDEKEIRAQLANWLAAEAQVADSYQLDTDSIVIDKSNYGITAKVTANVDTTFLRVIGKDTVPIAVEASVIGGEDPGAKSKRSFSMYFVFDRSGSMGDPTEEEYETECKKKNGQTYMCTKVYTKMESLKLATAALLNQFVAIDDKSELIRTGAVSYNNVMQTPTPLAWGVSSVSSYVNALSATGTTNSGEALQKAYDSLMVTGLKSEENEHTKMNGNATPEKYIVFMTDGANNISGADAKTKTYCDKARAAKVKVYSIAFMAPTEGEALLRYCATTAGDYYEPQNTSGLVKAFENIAKDASKRIIRLTN